MYYEDAIRKLTDELCQLLNTNERDIISMYLQRAMVFSTDIYLNPVAMVTDTGEIIKKFNNPQEATNYIRKKFKRKSIDGPRKAIERCLNNKGNTSYGYHWKRI